MKGSYAVRVSNARLSYSLKVNRNITILRGNSATGKTTLIEMVQAYAVNGRSSGITIQCERPCTVLPSLNWQANLSMLHENIIFIDEGNEFIQTREFARAIQNSDNYYVIATRSSLFHLPYSILEVYGLKNQPASRYQDTKRLYTEFYPLYENQPMQISRPDCVLVEDTNAGYEFFKNYFSYYGIPCYSAAGKSNLYGQILELQEKTILIIADGAAFGPEIERILSLRNRKKLIIYLPESFEWMVLKSDLQKDAEIRNMLEEPSQYIESSKYFSWERFFTAVLTERSAGTWLQYQKRKLNPVYLQKHEAAEIVSVMPRLAFQKFL